MDIWNSVTRWHNGAWINRAIIKCRAKACVIQRTLSITLTDAERAYIICRDEFKRLKPDADVYSARFLTRRVKEDFQEVMTRRKDKLRVSWIERY